MDKVLPYFSFRGRANRQRYWVTVLLVYMAVVVDGFVALGFAGAPWFAALVMLPAIPTLLAGLAVAVRRLHDRGKSGWWLIPMYVPLLLLSLLGALVQAAEGRDPVWSAITLPFSIWILVDLGCLKGTTGENRFGPDPLGPPMAAEVFS